MKQNIIIFIFKLIVMLPYRSAIRYELFPVRMSCTANIKHKTLIIMKPYL